jgi:hypothetical protein
MMKDLEGANQRFKVMAKRTIEWKGLQRTENPIV